MKSFRSFSVILGLILFGVVSLMLLLAAQPGQAGTTDFQFKDQDGVPVTGEVRILCFDGITAVSPFADLTVQVDAGLPTEALPARCTHLAALHLRHTQPSGKHGDPAYWIYATSWNPGDTTPQPANGDIFLYDDRPLTLLNLVVSLGWTPAPNSTVATSNEIYAAIQEASADLYDATEGQMAIGPVSIHTGGERWTEADMRFLPANDKRPSAFVGGIVPDKLEYTGYLTDTTYTPAATYYGRLWDGRDAFDEVNGRWSQINGSRTILHEWAHHSLFLYDAYQDRFGGTGYCICTDLSSTGCRLAPTPDASLLAYHYNPAAEFWHKDTHLTVDDFCYDTWQNYVHGGTDWDTLNQWHTIQGLGLPASLHPLRQREVPLTIGPDLGLAVHLFGTEPGYGVYLPVVLRDGVPAAPPQEPLINIILDSPNPPTATLPTQVYLLQGGGDDPNRILPQGRVTGSPSGNVLGALRLLDVSSNDDVRVFTERPGLGATPGTRFTLDANTGPLNDITVTANPWQFALDHHFDLVENTVMTLTVALIDHSGTMSIPKIQLCSLDADIGCHADWDQAMTSIATGEWQATFTPLSGQKELPRYAVVRLVDADDNAVADELVQWIQMGGGVGPTHKDGFAPLLDDVVMVNVSQPLALAGDCNVVSYMPAANSAAAQASLPPGFGGLIGIPLDIDITLTNDLCPKWGPNQNQPFPQNINVFLNFGYSQDEVTRLGIPEAWPNLQLLHYNPGTGWSTTQQNGMDTNLNWVTAPIDEDGIYAIGWQP